MSCPNFIGYTFAHLAGASALTAAGAAIDVLPNTLVALVVAAITTLILTFVLLRMPPSPFKYGLFIIYTLLLGSLLEPLVARLKQRGLLFEVLVTVAGIFGTMTLVGFADRQNMLGLGPYLLAGLVGLIVAQFILWILASAGKISATQEGAIRKPLLWFGLALFTLFVGYDTQILKANARACKRGDRPDYINESLGLYLDLLNLFTKVGELFSD